MTVLVGESGAVNGGHDSRTALHSSTSICEALETDCVAGHVGFEPANPSASYLIGFGAPEPHHPPWSSRKIQQMNWRTVEKCPYGTDAINALETDCVAGHIGLELPNPREFIPLK